jgi:membrane protease YdiL (CAAX protease family)
LSGAAQVAALVLLLLADANVLSRGFRQIGLVGVGLARTIRAAAVGAVIAIPLTLAASLIFQLLWPALGLSPPTDHELIRIMKSTPGRELRWLIALTAIFVAPFFEELLFRGHFQTALAATFRAMIPPPPPRGFEPVLLGELQMQSSEAPRPPAVPAEPTWPRWAAIIFTSLLFAMVHEAGSGSRWMLPPLFLLSLCLGYAYERTGNLRVPIIMHAAFNALSVTFVLLI